MNAVDAVVFMDRERLALLTINQLRKLVAQLNLSTKNSRVTLFERILNHCEENGWLEQLPEMSPENDRGEEVQVNRTRDMEEEMRRPSIAGPTGNNDAPGGIPNVNVQDIVHAVIRETESGERRKDDSWDIERNECEQYGQHGIKRERKSLAAD